VRERIASQILFSGVDWSTTRAYHTAESPGDIRVNLRGREAKGIVKPGTEYDAVHKAIASGLEKYIDPDTGKHVVERVFRRDELYWGPYVDLAPDLIVHLADYSYTFDWYIPTVRNGAQGNPRIVDRLTGKFTTNCGYHRTDGILMLCGANICKGAQLNPAQIYDVTPTVLYLLGLPIPTDMDGRVLTESIKAELLDRRPVEHRAPTSPTTEVVPPAETYSEAEAETVAQRLRELGYL
jgi:predicted AlkP superfamily phosphohydrolase/phosphomutase